MLKSHVYTVWENSNELKKSIITYMMKYYNCDRRAMFKNLDGIGRRAIKNNITDINAVGEMLKILKQNPTQLETNSQKRLSDRKSQLCELIGDAKICKYLDYGCGDASITKEVSNVLKILPENTFAVDILSPEKLAATPNLDDINYLSADEFMQKSPTVNLVTAFMSLHHVGQPRQTVERIHQTLDLDGLLIIREHNFDGSPEMLSFLHLVHIFNDLKIDGHCDLKVLEDETIYRSKSQWGELIKNAGFTFIKETNYVSNNPQGIYHALYKKINQ